MKVKLRCHLYWNKL